MYASAPYRHAPAALQSALIGLRGAMRQAMREGDLCRRHAEELARTERFGQEALANWQREQLHRSWLALRRTPFGAGLPAPPSPRALAKDWAAAWQALPILDRPQVAKLGTALCTPAGPWWQSANWRFGSQTSGSSGAPLRLVGTRDSVSREQALVRRQMQWAGWRPSDRRAWLRGDLVHPVDRLDGPFWRDSASERMRYFSSYHLSDATLEAYVRALQDWDPVLIQAYPSSLALLAQALRARGRSYEGRGLRGLMTSSETLGEGERAVIEQVFGVRVSDWYGQTERVAAIGQCEHGSLHVIEDYGFVEWLPREDGLFELVGSAFGNEAMPLLRYATGDLVELLPEEAPPCPCGRAFRRVRRVLGRQDDVVHLPDGRRIGRLDGIFKDLQGLLEWQIRQERVEEIEILYVLPDGAADFDEARMERAARERLGAGIGLRIRRVPRIQRTRAGKLRGVVCLVGKAAGAEGAR
ncbi:MAG: phenylacetate--CoA ligase family protein [Burkholderiales bacterium]|nr:phenylacetate--CoA ligase family protein [Burkholderiales bacterium]